MSLFARREMMCSMAAFGAASVTVAPAIGKVSRGALDVTISDGKLTGALEANGTRVWRGIPFGCPPIGALRGRAPQPAQRWTGVRSATKFGHPAIQQALELNPAAGIGSEDCLYLNVWAPEQPSASLRPVIVWIHGGGYVFGSGSERAYWGDSYAAQGELLFVTFNYRLNGFGFLRTTRDAGSANIGLLDQMAALRWVRDNIAAFGGDPAQVTVMGESAGGMSIGCLLGAPAARGLFHRAIIQSGGARPVYLAPEPAQVLALALSEAGLRPGEDEKLLALPANELSRVFKAMSAASNTALLGGEAFHPAVDGAVLPLHPLRSLASVPTVIGHCENESATFAGLANLIEGLPKRLRSLMGELRWARLEEAYAQSPRPQRNPTMDLFSDMFTGIPSQRLANGLVAAGASVWAYRFDYQKASPIGAAHAADIAFTFGQPQGAPFPVEWSTEAQAVSTLMRDSFIAFARTGSPQTAALPQWRRQGVEDLAYMRFDSESTLGQDPIGACRRAAWQDVPIDAV